MLRATCAVWTFLSIPCGLPISAWKPLDSSLETLEAQGQVVLVEGAAVAAVLEPLVTGFEVFDAEVKQAD